mmetsp:Transcript_35843/g.54949  ORF Transcript_35843/g.54949 Transcript_35843/m.54949 type:complete len:111 (+) Transcript_35843:5594-5926(+)
MDSAKTLLSTILKSAPASAGGEELDLDLSLIRQCFLSSKMTVIDEGKNNKDYLCLEYAEFLEFLSRFSFHFWSEQELLNKPFEEPPPEPPRRGKKKKIVDEGKKIEHFVF